MLSWPPWALWTLGSLLAAAGLALLLWSLFWDRSRGRKRCPKCWYSMEGAVPSAGVLTCPECGAAIRKKRGLHKTRRRWLGAFAGLAACAAGIYASLWPRVRAKGWLSFVPTSILLSAAFSDHSGSLDSIHSELSYHRFAEGDLGFGRHAIISSVIEHLNSDLRADKRKFACELLAWVGADDPRITPALLAATSDRGAEVRVQAIRSFGTYLADSSRVVPRLAQIIRNQAEDPAVRSEAIGVLTRYGPAAQIVAGDVWAAIGDESAEVRASAAYTIGFIAADDDPRARELLSLLPNPPAQFSYDWGASFWGGAVKSLGKFRSIAPQSVSVLLSQLSRTSDPELQFDLVLALSRLGTDAAPAAPALKAIAADPNSEDRLVSLCNAGLDVIQGRSPDAATALASQVCNPNSTTHAPALSALLFMDRAAGPAVPTIIRDLDTSMDPVALSRLCGLIPNLGEQADPIRPALIRLRQRWPDPMVDFAIRAIDRRETGKR